ncbi:MAG: Ig-like domain-containing protein, partial [Gammaproteobacteria bacterium]|nr:Ig-like domain-containing protein [Gammaproteobacteria bacterium]
ADMGIQPTTLQDSLVPATASSDDIPPTSQVEFPVDGSVLPREPVVIRGTAADEGGGAVAAVEVSVDNGIQWHPAMGRETWFYEWLPGSAGPVTILSRAVDDSCNLENLKQGVSVLIE